MGGFESVEERDKGGRKLLLSEKPKMNIKTLSSICQKINIIALPKSSRLRRVWGDPDVHDLNPMSKIPIKRSFSADSLKVCKIGVMSYM